LSYRPCAAQRSRPKDADGNYTVDGVVSVDSVKDHFLTIDAKNENGNELQQELKWSDAN